MKRIGIISIVLVLAILLTGCGKEPEEVTNAKAMIDGIQEVSYKSYEQIKQARNAYDGLTEKEKKSVTNYEVLLSAEKEFDDLISPVISVVKTYSEKLKDPKSMRLYGDILWAPYTSTGNEDPFCICSFKYDAKNSWGGYSGAKTIEIYITDDDIAYYDKEDSIFLNLLADQDVRDILTKTITFQPEIFSTECICDKLGLEYID